MADFQETCNAPEIEPIAVEFYGFATHVIWVAPVFRLRSVFAVAHPAQPPLAP